MRALIFVVILLSLAACTSIVDDLFGYQDIVETPGNPSLAPEQKHVLSTNEFTKITNEQAAIRYQADILVEETSIELQEFSYIALPNTNAPRNSSNNTQNTFELRTGEHVATGTTQYCIQDACEPTTELLLGEQSVTFEPIRLVDIQDTIELYINGERIQTIQRPQEPELHSFDILTTPENLLFRTNTSEQTNTIITYQVDKRVAVVDARPNDQRRYAKTNLRGINDSFLMTATVSDGFHMYQASARVSREEVGVQVPRAAISIREETPIEVTPGTGRSVTIDNVYNPVTNWYRRPHSTDDMNYEWVIPGLEIEPYLDTEYQQLRFSYAFWENADYEYGEYELNITAWPKGHEELQETLSVPIRILSPAQEQHNKGDTVRYVWAYEQPDQKSISIQENTLTVQTTNANNTYEISDAQVEEILRNIEKIEPYQYGNTKPATHQLLDLWIESYACADFTCSIEAIEFKNHLFETLSSASNKNYTCTDFQQDTYCVFERATQENNHQLCYELERPRSCIIQVAARLQQPSLCEEIDSRYQHVCLRQVNTN